MAMKEEFQIFTLGLVNRASNPPLHLYASPPKPRSILGHTSKCLSLVWTTMLILQLPSMIPPEATLLVTDAQATPTPYLMSSLTQILHTLF